MHIFVITQLGWLNLPHLDHFTVDKDFKTLCSDYAMRSVQKRGREKRLRKGRF